MSLGSFTQEDVTKMRKFSTNLVKHASWTGIGTKELMEIYGLLMWYNSLGEKIEASIFEVKAEGSLDEEPKPIDAREDSDTSQGDSE